VITALYRKSANRFSQVEIDDWTQSAARNRFFPISLAPPDNSSILSPLTNQLMELFFTALALFLLFNILLGLGRILRGPTMADRMLSIQLFGTTGVGMLLLLSESIQQPALRDVALVFALLAVLAMIAYVRLVIRPVQRTANAEADS
jgi:multicomponent Na+:H+ antiporter subunit F